MTADVCEEFYRQKPGNSDVISVIMSLRAGALSRELLGRFGRDQFKPSFVARRVLRCVRDPTDEQRHTTAPFPSLSPAGAARRRPARPVQRSWSRRPAGRPSVRRSPLSKQRLSVQLCRVTSTSRISRHLVRLLPCLSLRRPGTALFIHARVTNLQFESADRSEDVHLPVAAASVPVQSVIGVDANQLYVCRRVNGDAYVSATFCCCTHERYLQMIASARDLSEQRYDRLFASVCGFFCRPRRQLRLREPLMKSIICCALL